MKNPKTRIYKETWKEVVEWLAEHPSLTDCIIDKVFDGCYVIVVYSEEIEQ